MYKILVISDTHKKITQTLKLMDKIPDVDHIFHLGDLVSDAIDIASVVDIPVDYVAGNCDFYERNARTTKIVEIGQNKFFLTHGHHYNVKHSMTDLERMAKEENYSGILFGHTHMAHMSYIGNTLLLNPGSISKPKNSQKPTFAILQVDARGAVHATLNDL